MQGHVRRLLLGEHGVPVSVEHGAELLRARIARGNPHQLHDERLDRSSAVVGIEVKLLKNARPNNIVRLVHQVANRTDADSVVLFLIGATNSVGAAVHNLGESLKANLPPGVEVVAGRLDDGGRLEVLGDVTFLGEPDLNQ